MQLKNAISDRVIELSKKIEELHIKRQDLVGELKSIDLEIHVTSKIIMELSSLLSGNENNQSD